MPTQLSFDDIADGAWWNESRKSSKPGILGDYDAQGRPHAFGPMQVHQAALDDVNKQWGTNYTLQQLTDQPELGIKVGRQYLQNRYSQFGGDPAATLASYNAGPGAVQSALKAGSGLPAQAYVNSALGHLGQGTGATPTASNTDPGSASAVGPTVGNPLLPNADIQAQMAAYQATQQRLQQNALLTNTLAGFKYPVKITPIDYDPFQAAAQGGQALGQVAGPKMSAPAQSNVKWSR